MKPATFEEIDKIAQENLKSKYIKQRLNTFQDENDAEVEE